MLQNNSALKSKIDQLWDKFWSGGISNPLTAIEQITYLLFMKRLDDLELKKKADAEGETFPADLTELDEDAGGEEATEVGRSQGVDIPEQTGQKKGGAVAVAVEERQGEQGARYHGPSMGEAR